MKRFLSALLLGLPALLYAGAEQMVPAGSDIQCMVSEPKISSQTMAVGDPVLCQVSHVELYGRSVFPYGAYLEGRFEAYKDPGHFVGKGWMELKFDRMVVGNDTVIPISSRVVDTSDKYHVDMEGRIHGNGHPVRDAIEWAIPVLWPIDLINLPRRGPRPVLKAETRLTVKLLDDIGLPTKLEVQHQPELVSRFNYADNTPVQQDAAPIERSYAQPSNYAQPQYQPQSYAQPAYQPQPAYQQPPQTSPTVIVVQAAAPQQPAMQQPYVIQQPVAYPYMLPPPPPPRIYAHSYYGYAY